MSRFLHLFFGMPGVIAPKFHRAYYVTLIGLYIALSLHATWLVFFGAWGLEALFYFNIFSVLAFVTAIVLVRAWGMISASMLLAALETLSHQIFAVYILGWGYGFELYVLAVIAYIFYGDFKTMVIPTLMTLFSLGVFLFIYFTVQHLRGVHETLPPLVHDIFFITNVISIFFIISVFAYIFSSATRKAEAKLELEYQKSEKLLLNILPESIARRLKEVDDHIADNYEAVTVLFTDMVGFTQFSARHSPKELVKILNTYFEAFDALAERYGVEKIKTIGDSYMAVAGVPEHTRNHALIMVKLAQEMLKASQAISEKLNTQLAIRIGLSSGPVTAGVIGHKKFLYDVWGDTVNMASRMETTAQPNTIQLSSATYELVKEKIAGAAVKIIEVKGKGNTEVYLLEV